MEEGRPPGSAPLASLGRRGNTALIILNRPSTLNAMHADLSAAVGGALEEFAVGPGPQVAVVIGAGRASRAGMDLKDRPGPSCPPATPSSSPSPERPGAGLKAAASHIARSSRHVVRISAAGSAEW